MDGGRTLGAAALVVGALGVATGARGETPPYAQQMDAAIRSSEPVLACVATAYKRQLLVARVDVSFDVSGDGAVSDYRTDAADPDDEMLRECFQSAITSLTLPPTDAPGRMTYTFAWDNAGARSGQISIRVGGGAGMSLDLVAIKNGLQQNAEPLLLCLVDHGVGSGEGLTAKLQVQVDGTIKKVGIAEGSGVEAADACVLGVLGAAWIDGVGQKTKTEVEISWSEV